MPKVMRRRTKPSLGEKAMGVQSTVKDRPRATALDWFVNQAARTGFNSPNLLASSGYELVRFSYNYWDLITLYRNHWISRRIVDVPAQDMVRAWPKLVMDRSPEDIGKIDKAIKRTFTRSQYCRGMEWGNLFGGAGCLIVIDGHEDKLHEKLDLDDIPLGGYKGLIPFDRWANIMPGQDICRDINRPADFAKPDSYHVSVVGGESFEVHSSRILRMTGPEVPTPEREAQSWWGISVLEPVYEEIQKRDNMSHNILMLTFRANLLGMEMEGLDQLLSGTTISQAATRRFYAKLESFNQILSNQSFIPYPKGGQLQSTQYSFAGVSEVYQQFQLDISGAAQIPVTRLWGRTITGLGQSNDADERIYEENIATKQENDMRPQLDKLYPVLCMSELGELPDDYDLSFPSVRVLDEKEKSELAKSVVDTLTVTLNSGVISPRTYGKELKRVGEITDVFTNVTDEQIEKLSDDTEPEDAFGEEAGGAEQLDPAASPQKVVREEAKAGKGKAEDSDGSGPVRYIHGLECVVETPKGDSRSGPGWEQVMPYDYGYIRGQSGADGDSLDVAIGPSSNGWVYLIDQRVLGGKSFDETKCFVNWPSARHALNAFKAGHHKADDVMMDWTPLPVEDFKQWLKTRDVNKPAASA